VTPPRKKQKKNSPGLRRCSWVVKSDLSVTLCSERSKTARRVSVCRGEVFEEGRNWTVHRQNTTAYCATALVAVSSSSRGSRTVRRSHNAKQGRASCSTWSSTGGRRAGGRASGGPPFLPGERTSWPTRARTADHTFPDACQRPHQVGSRTSASGGTRPKPRRYADVSQRMVTAQKLQEHR